MKVMRKMEVSVNGKSGGFKVGDQIYVGKHYTATCQKVGKYSAIFMFDQYLDEALVMNQNSTNEGGYEASDLRKFLKKFVMDSIFDEIREIMVPFGFPFKNSETLLRIPTAEEMFGPEEAHKYYETLSLKNQWPLMKDRHYRVAFRKNYQDGEWGWLQNKYNKKSDDFAAVDPSGGTIWVPSSVAYGVRVVFQLSV